MKQVRVGLLATACAAAALWVFAPAPAAAAGRGNGQPLGTVYVSGQGLYYDTFATTMLPPRGRFQPLDPNGVNGPTTPYGPGDPGYVGGRWWVDTNLDGEMDAMDMYFSCPLLGPGRTEP